MRFRRCIAIGVSLSAVALSACSGPKAPLDVGTQAAPVDLVLGEHEAVVEAPVGPISIALPREFAPFLPIGRAPVQEKLEPCPDFDPLAPVASGGVIVEGPPQNATYTYRAKTTDTVGNMSAKYAGDSTWKVTVGAVDQSTGQFEFTTEVTIGPVKSSRLFRVLVKANAGENTAAADPTTTDLNYQTIDQYNATAPLVGAPPLPRSLVNVGRYGLPGIYLVSQTTGDDAFTPTVPIPLLQMPVVPTSFDGIGTDGETVMKFLSTVKSTSSPVNACGKKIEAIEVSLTNGQIAGLLDNGQPYSIEFTETLYFGLQYGGLPIRDEGKVVATGVSGGDKIERTFDFTTNVAPKPAKTAT